MKRGTGLVLLFVFFAFLTVTAATEVIRNGTTPTAAPGKTPNRVLDQTEVLRITDEGGEFVFKEPRWIRVAPDKSVFVGERGQLLKFTSQGRFVKNFLKMGEGPGEVKYFSNFYLHPDGVVVGAYMPSKILFFASDGAFGREFRVPGSFPAIKFFMHGAKNKFYLQSMNLSPEGIKTGINERSHRITHCNDQGQVTKTDLVFTTQDAVIKQTSESGGIAISMDEITYFITVFDGDKYLYVSHTGRYMVTQVDLKTEKIVRKFTRAYRPVDYVEREDLEEEDAKLEEIKNSKFYNDIYAMRVYEGKLLVFTSTMNKDKRVLVDVFDEKGQYIDNFYLRVPGAERPDDLRRKPMCFHDGHFWTVAIDEDDNPYAVKFKLGL